MPLEHPFVHETTLLMHLFSTSMDIEGIRRISCSRFLCLVASEMDFSLSTPFRNVLTKMSSMSSSGFRSSAVSS